MKLEAFRLQNYKKVQDTGWVDCESLTALVGKNEAGKSAILRGLSKLKPTDGMKYDGLREFPHGRYTDEFKTEDWPAASGRFTLSQEERKQLAGISSIIDKVKTVTVTRHYSDAVAVDFHPSPMSQPVSKEEWIGFLEKTGLDADGTVAPDGKGDAWTPKKTTIRNLLQKQTEEAKGLKSDPDLARIDSLRSQLLGQMSEEWTKQIITPMVSPLEEFRSRLAAIVALGDAQKWVLEQMPYFLYFGNYEVLKSTIYLPEFVSRGQDKNPQIRVQGALFKHVGVDIRELAALGLHQHGQGDKSEIRRQLDELSIKAHSASQAMTKKFAGWWMQRHHRFSYRFQGDYFRIWVSDDLDPAEVEFEERSLGMQYFFSFYLLFIVEAEEQHRNCILLLDEPGLHLHGTAQQKLIEFFEKLSSENQLIYTTHSPFMIDGRHLERTKAIFETPTGTKISTDIWPKDRDTLFPLQAALGYSVCQSLFLSRKQLLVEGPTDYLLLAALDEALSVRAETHLKDDIVMLPVGGAKNMAPLASLFAGHDIEVVMLMDSDKAAQTSVQKVKNIMADLGNRCLQAKQFSEDPLVQELEDLIPQSYYLDAVQRAYPDVRLDFSSSEKSVPNIIDRLTALFTRLGRPKLDKRLPVHVIAKDIRTSAPKVPNELFDLGKRIFSAVNTAFGE